MGGQADEAGGLISEVLTALQLQACATSYPLEGDDLDGAEEMEEDDLDDEQIIALANNGWAEGANFATASAETKASLKKKAIGFCKGELKASIDKRKTLGVVQSIAAKAKKTRQSKT